MIQPSGANDSTVGNKALNKQHKDEIYVLVCSQFYKRKDFSDEDWLVLQMYGWLTSVKDQRIVAVDEAELRVIQRDLCKSDDLGPVSESSFNKL